MKIQTPAYREILCADIESELAPDDLDERWPACRLSRNWSAKIEGASLGSVLERRLFAVGFDGQDYLIKLSVRAAHVNSREEICALLRAV